MGLSIVTSYIIKQDQRITVTLSVTAKNELYGHSTETLQ